MLDKQPNNNAICHLAISNDQLHQQMEKFWSVEELQSEKPYSKEELMAENCFIESASRDESGRLTVSLPIKSSRVPLGNSLETAIARFKGIEKRLAKSPELKKQYVEFMAEYENLGHMEEIINPNLEVTHFYLPHHPILKDSLTTKCRIVFDASARTDTGGSLNDILLGGPVVQAELISILMRFRNYNVVITADVEKMYRQVKLDPMQCDLQRIVWRDDTNQELSHYRLLTVTYGTKPASFLATRTLIEIANQNTDRYPEACSVISRDFYVDDIITHFQSLESENVLQQQISHILSSAGFMLRKWASNKKEILQDFSATEDVPEYYITDNKSDIKTLGLYWNANEDNLKYKVNIGYANRITKRSILSTLSQVYDPLGLVGPIIVIAKIIMQSLWKLKMGWDEAVPLDIYTSWTEFRDKLVLLNGIVMPRHVLLPDYNSIQMHVFCDASNACYGCCIYLRSVDNTGRIKVELLCAKSRVAPFKTISLPRLELCGAVLAARLAHKTQQALQTNFNSLHFWCDSTIALAWIRSEPNRWKTFVGNRVSEIQTLTNPVHWRHVSTGDNSADIISRGMPPDQLARSKLWFNGPVWLSKPEISWTETTFAVSDEASSEAKKYKEHSLITSEPVEFLNRFSSFSKLIRVIAYVRRFIKNCNIPKQDRSIAILSVSELNNAKDAILKLVQTQEFSAEQFALKNKRAIPKNSKLLSLNIFLDPIGLIRVGGRLRHAIISYAKKRPIVVPKTHFITTLIIRHEHETHMHAGIQATLAAVRSNYWPLSGKSVVRSVLHNCVKCFRARPREICPLMGDLPEHRVRPLRPFSTCGCDFAGPFPIKDGKLRNRKIIKSYLCIFVCFATKACHLELVSDLSSDSFLQRFVSRRGICQHIYSDNGTNFAGANSDLSALTPLLGNINEGKLGRYWSNNAITWHFSPARSPHFGGIWEAAVKSAKYHIKRIVGNAHLTFEALYTVFTLVEAVLNSRPLTPLSNDPNDFQPLTPGHFLIGDALKSIPSTDMTRIAENRLTTYQRIQKMLQHFWDRWSQEYLTQLQQQSKWKCQPTSTQLVPGTLVVLKNSNTAPMQWHLGRISAVHPGTDNIVRVVTVQTQGGSYKRGVSQICVLPVFDSHGTGTAQS